MMSARHAGFRKTVLDYYEAHGRHDLPWRGPAPDGTLDAYHVMLSELMLQQTQVVRVILKYRSFLEQFPALADLARAEQGTVLRAWNGLGYNRRAKFLHQAARRIVEEHGGRVPEAVAELVTLPGIGVNTAGAIAAYAYNKPAVFVETNVRTVFIHHFFHDQAAVPEPAIRKLVAATLDNRQPRVWYWALMDYGTYLKRTIGNLNKLSNVYARQSAFAGSRRQLRGQILRLLGEQSRSPHRLASLIDDERLDGVLEDLLQEGLIYRSESLLHL